ncbi:hypothetical protein C8Q76DRAFT_804084 [Earliella scabrosa]|nr:hypothetical protein C8Q76DRAFT_804084 [Earliella scabrosa]
MSAKIEDIDPQVVYVGEWFRDNFTSASGGSRHGAALSGVTVTLEFRGTSIQVVGMLDDSPHFGLPVTAYDIDGQHITTVHAPWSDSRQFNYVHFEKTDLSPGDHTLIVTNMNGTTTTVIVTIAESADYGQLLPSGVHQFCLSFGVFLNINIDIDLAFPKYRSETWIKFSLIHILPADLHVCGIGCLHFYF